MKFEETPEYRKILGEVLDKLITGNPLLDKEAYNKALEKCPNQEAREMLTSMHDSAQEELGEYIRRMRKESGSPKAVVGQEA